MRLSQIKLAGFKSFVDPTAIPVPGQLVGVVGPNGCGKSNVIDAVRWVLGESSAKQLRGESMQDVIFNGSTTRKPVSRASVELVFDNGEGRAAGQWSQYAEISIKRVLTRQGESSYHINNVQCRRRDIADLFLGTGVGSRGYAVIEQGMIARIIEARPEELRAFLEEAAGVTKYKDRRRETETRMADTRENLTRLEDLRIELAGQIEKLSTQAEMASAYRALKDQITEKQNLLALQRKRDAEQEALRRHQEMMATQIQLELQTAHLRETEATLETLREAHYSASDTVQLAQTRLSEATARVARLEQQLLHMRQNRQRLQTQIDQCQAQTTRLITEQSEIATETDTWARTAEEALLQRDTLQSHLQAELDRLPELEARQKSANHDLSEAQMAFSLERQNAQLAKQQAEHLTRTLGQLQQRQTRLHTSLASLTRINDDELQAQQLELEALVMALETTQQGLIDTEHQLLQHEARHRLLQDTLEQQRAQRAETQGRRDALSRLQTGSGLGKPLAEWLTQHGLHADAQLFKSMRVTPGWETAVEAILRERLLALIARAIDPPRTPSPARLILVQPCADTPKPPLATHPAGLTPLIQHIHADEASVHTVLQDWLAHVWCVPDDPSLLTARHSLPPQAGAILVAPSGHAASRQALHFHASDDAHSGVVHREAEIALCDTALTDLDPALQRTRQELDASAHQSTLLQAALKQARADLDTLRQQRAECQIQVSRQQHAAEQERTRREGLTHELVDIEQEIADTCLEKSLLDETIATLGDALPSLEHQVEIAKTTKAEAETALDILHGKTRQLERSLQEHSFAAQTAHARNEELARRKLDLQNRIDTATQQAEDAALELSGIDEADFDIGFQEALDQLNHCEHQLSQQRNILNATTNQLREQELAKQQIEQGFEPLRESIGQLRLQEQEARLLADRFSQELTEAGADESALHLVLGDGVKVASLVGEIGRLSQRINALGNVNLAALEELQAATERKHWLDAQFIDLSQALETLENAIRKIDRETRAMLQATFEKVNHGLSQLFPTLFGGGHAELTLTGDEILNAGLQIMAHPPGKKNSTIHLLSGGEKALTALSLVFSLFQLNPAPFCLLDEVDAPLDDANTGRFCRMVKQMSAQTQFLYISHNKITMEMADQLVGITMQEQGVSRVVAVDIQQALQWRSPSSSA